MTGAAGAAPARRWFEPLARDPLELGLMRFAFAAVVAHGVVINHRWSSGQPFPTGFANWFDLSFLSVPAAFWTLFGIHLVAAALYVAGRFMIPALAFQLLFVTGVFTLSQSQGSVSHATHIVPLVLLAQLCGYVAARAARALDWPARATADELAVHLSLQAIAAAYVVAGLSKLIQSEGSWIRQLPLMAVSIVRANDQRYYGTLAPHDGLDRALEIGQFLAAHPTLTQVLLGGGLVLELLAFLILLNRRAAFAIGIALVAMHVLVFWLQRIYFRFNVLLLLIFVVNVPFVVAWMWRRYRGRTAGSGVISRAG